MPEMKVQLSVRDIAAVVDTLKNIDVRGYDSMNRLVATVVFFENMLNAAQDGIGQSPEAETIKRELEKRGELNNG